MEISTKFTIGAAVLYKNKRYRIEKIIIGKDMEINSLFTGITPILFSCCISLSSAMTIILSRYSILWYPMLLYPISLYPISLYPISLYPIAFDWWVESLLFVHYESDFDSLLRSFVLCCRIYCGLPVPVAFSALSCSLQSPPVIVWTRVGLIMNAV